MNFRVNTILEDVKICFIEKWKKKKKKSGWECIVLKIFKREFVFKIRKNNLKQSIGY